MCTRSVTHLEHIVVVCMLDPKGLAHANATEYLLIPVKFGGPILLPVVLREPAKCQGWLC